MWDLKFVCPYWLKGHKKFSLENTFKELAYL